MLPAFPASLSSLGSSLLSAVSRPVPASPSPEGTRAQLPADAGSSSSPEEDSSCQQVGPVLQPDEGAEGWGSRSWGMGTALLHKTTLRSQHRWTTHRCGGPAPQQLPVSCEASQQFTPERVPFLNISPTVRPIANNGGCPADPFHPADLQVPLAADGLEANVPVSTSAQSTCQAAGDLQRECCVADPLLKEHTQSMQQS